MEVINGTLEKPQTNTGRECKDPIHRHANNVLSVGRVDLRSRDLGEVPDPRRARDDHKGISMGNQSSLRSWTFVHIFAIALILFGVASCNSSTSTPLVPDNTLTPTRIPATKTPIATSTSVSSPTEPEPGSSSRLFLWNPFYGYVDSLQPYASVTGIKGNLPKDKNPSKAVSLGFSPYSNQIAYLLKNSNGYLELWISDLMLTHPQQVWVDKNNELGYINKSIDQVFEIKWNLDDNFVLLSRFPTINSDAEASFLFSVHDNQLLKPSSSLGYLLASPETGKPALAFEMSDGFVVLELDGPYHEEQSLPANKIPVLDAVFSPDKEKVLYIAGEKIYLKSNEEVIDLNIGYTQVWHDKDQVILQWSQTGNRVLVYGVDLSGKYCLEAEFGSEPCWQVLDGLTGEHLWWESRPTNSVAAISPDGKQVARSMYLPGSPSVHVTDVDTKNTEFILDNAVSSLHWSGK